LEWAPRPGYQQSLDKNSDESGSGRSFAHDEMQYQRDHREYEQKVNQAARDMEHSETAEPSD
jgi:hypothetical protein